jgi:hypothetical protein
VKIVDESLRVLELIQERLEKENDLNPIKILGIPLTMNLINAFNTTFLSVVAAMINAKFKFFS